MVGNRVGGQAGQGSRKTAALGPATIVQDPLRDLDPQIMSHALGGPFGAAGAEPMILSITACEGINVARPGVPTFPLEPASSPSPAPCWTFSRLELPFTSALSSPSQP